MPRLARIVSIIVTVAAGVAVVIVASAWVMKQVYPLTNLGPGERGGLVTFADVASCFPGVVADDVVEVATQQALPSRTKMLLQASVASRPLLRVDVSQEREPYDRRAAAAALLKTWRSVLELGGYATTPLEVSAPPDASAHGFRLRDERGGVSTLLLFVDRARVLGLTVEGECDLDVLMAAVAARLDGGAQD